MDGRNHAGRLLLGGIAFMAAAGPATGAEIDELKAQLEALQRRVNQLESEKSLDLPPPQKAKAAAAPDPGFVATAGSFPGSPQIPGTNTSVKVGGYVKLDAYYDFGPKGGSDAQDATSVPLSGTPAHERDGYGHLDAKYSRLNVESRTPTDFGEFTIFSEMDFAGSTSDTNLNVSKNGYAPRLRYAYGRLGNFLAGQYDSAFRDIAAEYESLDSGYSTGINDNRVAQIRYTVPVWTDAGLALSVENPETDYTTTAGVAQNSTNGGITFNRLPDFVAALNDKTEWGHWNVHAVARDLRLDDGAHHGGEKFGWGVGASFAAKTWGADKVLGQISYGDGIGRYITDAAGSSLIFNSATNLLTTQTAFGAALGYQHWWLEGLRSNVNVGYTHIEPSSELTSAGADVFNHKLTTAAVNLMWSPIPRIDTGLEYLFARRVTQGGPHGNQHRLLYSIIWRF